MSDQIPAEIAEAIQNLHDWAIVHGGLTRGAELEVREARAALDAVILRAIGMSGWRSIDTAPQDKTPVDLWIVDRISGLQWREPDAWYDDDWWWTLSLEGGEGPVGQPGIQDPFYWRPVPPCPDTTLGRAALAEEGRGT